MKEFGSGYFGEWITDEYGLPAYRYTTDHLNDPKAQTPTNPTWRRSNDHTFQFGNQRIIAVCSNSGTVQVRQDEGTPKFLGDVNEEQRSFGGGIGWLTDGEEVLSTYYDGKAEEFERLYGVGYMRKKARKGELYADQTIFAPFGEDPVLISRVTIKNAGKVKKNFRWFEYWSANPYLFSFRALLLSLGNRGSNLETFIDNAAADMRRKHAKKYRHAYTLEGSVLLEQKQFIGWNPIEKGVWEAVKKKCRSMAQKTHNASLYVGELEDFEDIHPPRTFLAALGDRTEGFVTDATAFFGKGGVNCPSGLFAPEFGRMKLRDTAMVAVSAMKLKAGEEITLTFIYGYLPDGFSVDALIQKYGENPAAAFAESCEAWKNDRIRLELAGSEWIDRELLWHHHALLSAASYDTGMNQYILSQGHVYQYIMGFQGAARDPLQHAMPFIFTKPQMVREVILYTLKEVLPDGEIPYGMCGHGAIMLSPIRPSDSELWLLWTVSEFILATKDTDFLKETVEPYPYMGKRQQPCTVLELLQRVYTHFCVTTGRGMHGLPRLLGGDWNDNIVMGSITPKQHEKIYAEGESVLVGAMAAQVFTRYARMLTFAGEDSAEITKQAVSLREAVKQQWNGKWLNRAWLGGDLGWIGEDLLWLEPQPWALMSNAVTGEQRKTLIEGIDRLLRNPSPIGAMLSSECPAQMKSPRGTFSNGGIWSSINGTLILALQRDDPDLAFEEWRKNTLAYHAEAYPEEWMGIWSGPDTYNSVLAEHPGSTYFEPEAGRRERMLNWTDFPVYNLHPHAWTLYNLACLFVDDFDEEGIGYSLGFGSEAYSFQTPLASLRRTPEGFFGSYAPSRSGVWRVLLSSAEEFSSWKLTVNGNPEVGKKQEDGRLAFFGTGDLKSPLCWELRP